MSQTIDERIVEMKFDNKQFEKGASTTMSTIDKLKKSLDFSKIGDSFSNITKSAKKVDISGLDNAITTVHNKFSALEVMAITSLGNITNSFINSAKRWASSFTIDPIKTGFQEYETQINSVQTILANTQKEGTNIKDVNAALDELNLYADKTIYNFTEMTRNIGTFTAAGVDLKTSVNAIQGIANLAAVSGSNSQQAATAMYQLSQALSSGTIRLMDWNSVVNAGMGGQLFQDALKETSRLLGTGVDAAIEAEGSFRESLSAGWLTAEVLTETLKKFTTSGAAEYVANYTGLTKEAITSELELAKTMYGEADAIDRAAEALANKSGKNKDEIAEALRFAQTAEDAATKVKTFTQLIDTLKEALQSGWSQSFRIIVGDFEEAKALFTEISDAFGAVISASSDARNKLLTEVFVKKDLQDYMASVVDVPKDAIDELQKVAKDAGTSSDLFKETLKTFTKGDKILDNVMTHLIGMVNSEQDVTSYIANITGARKTTIKELQRIGEEVGYASDNFMEFSNTLSKGNPEMAATITHLLQMSNAIKRPSGRELLIDSLRNGLKGLLSVVKPVQEAFKNVFPPVTAKQFYEMLESLNAFSKTLILSEKNSENLKNAFKGLFDFIKLIGDGFKSLVKLIIPIEKPINSLGNIFLDFIGNSGKALSKFTEWVRNSESISEAYDSIGVAIEEIGKRLDEFIKSSYNFVESVKDFPFVHKMIDFVKNAIDKLGSVTENFKIRFLPFKEVLDILLNIIIRSGPIASVILDKLGNAFSFLLNKISDFFGKSDFNSIYDIFNVAILSGIGIKLFDFIKNITKTVKTSKGLIESITEVLSSVTKTFDALQSTLKAQTLSAIAGSIALIAGSIFVLSIIDSEKLSGALAAVSILIGELTYIFTLLNKLDKNKKSAIGSIGSLFSISISILVLSSALKKISDINSEKLIGSLSAITILLAEMTGISIILSKYGGKVKTGAVGIIAFSAAIYILSSAVKKIGELDIDTLTKGLTSIGVLLTELMAFMIGAKFGKFNPKQAIGILILSSALIILQKAVDKFGSMDTKKLITGIVAVGAVLTEISAFSLIAGESKHILSTSISLIIMAKALEMLEKPFITFGTMNLSQIGKGLLAMGGALAGIVMTMRLIPKNALTIGISLISTAYALDIISDIVLKMSVMSWEEIAKGMMSLGTSMGILAISMNAMRGTLGASAAMFIMATSLSVFVPVLKTLSLMSWEEIAKGLIALAGGFAVIGISAALLTPVIPAMIGLSTAMALLGAAAAAVGIGIFSLSVGLTTLAASGVAGAAALIEVVKILIVGFLSVISDLAVAIGQTVKSLVLTFCDVLVECAPEIVETLFVLIKEVLTVLANNIPEIAKQLLKLIIGIIDVIASDLPTVIQSVVNLFMKFFSGLTQALSSIDINTLISGIAGIGLISAIMLALAATASLAPSAMIGVLAMGVVIAELAVVLAALGGLAQIPGLNWLIKEGGTILQSIGQALGNFIGGLVGGVMEGVIAQLPQIGTYLSDFMINLKPFIENSKNITEKSIKACSHLASLIISLTASNLISGISRFFGLSGSISDFGKELSDFGPYIKEFADTVKDVKPEAVKGASAAAEIMANVADKLPGSSGLAQKIFGTKSLKEFGEELLLFGPSIAAFAVIVKDVKPEAVEGAAAAAEIMTTLADKLPESDSLWDKLFGGGTTTFSEFGDELEKFGDSMVKFSKSVAGVQVLKINSVMECFEDILRIAEYVQNSSAAELVTFANQLNEMGSSLGDSITSGIRDALPNALFQMIGQNVVQGLIIGISSNGTVLISIVNDMLTVIVSKFRMELTTVRFVTIGQNAIQGLITGFGNRKDALVFAIAGLLTTIINKFRTDLSSTRFIAIGQNAVVSLARGMDVEKERINIVITQLCTYIIQSFTSYINEWTFRDIGENAALGLKYGIESKVGEISDAAIKAANEAVNSAKNALKVKSPSRVAWEIGEYFSLGLAGGILEKTNSIETSSLKAADKVANPIKRAVDIITEIINSGDFDIMPVVRPVMDLSNVQRGVNDISSLMNRKYDLSSTYNKVMDTSASFEKPKQNKVNNDVVNSKSGEGDTYQFNQYNYSPKALSRSEIYRQTNNQFSAFRRAVNPT